MLTHCIDAMQDFLFNFMDLNRKVTSNQLLKKKKKSNLITVIHCLVTELYRGGCVLFRERCECRGNFVLASGAARQPS